VEVPVLIVGGGPAGLCTSILLSRHGVHSLLVERHPTTSVHPRARGIGARVMELFRAWGIVADVQRLRIDSGALLFVGEDAVEPDDPGPVAG